MTMEENLKKKFVYDVPKESFVNDNTEVILSPSPSRIKEILSSEHYPLGKVSGRQTFRKCEHIVLVDTTTGRKKKRMARSLLTGEMNEDEIKEFWRRREGNVNTGPVEENYSNYLRKWRKGVAKKGLSTTQEVKDSESVDKILPAIERSSHRSLFEKLSEEYIAKGRRKKTIKVPKSLALPLSKTPLSKPVSRRKTIRPMSITSDKQDWDLDSESDTMQYQEMEQIESVQELDIATARSQVLTSNWDYIGRMILNLLQQSVDNCPTVNQMRWRVVTMQAAKQDDTVSEKVVKKLEKIVSRSMAKRDTVKSIKMGKDFNWYSARWDDVDTDKMFDERIAERRLAKKRRSSQDEFAPFRKSSTTLQPTSEDNQSSTMKLMKKKFSTKRIMSSQFDVSEKESTQNMTWDQRHRRSNLLPDLKLVDHDGTISRLGLTLDFGKKMGPSRKILPEEDEIEEKECADLTTGDQLETWLKAESQKKARSVQFGTEGHKILEELLASSKEAKRRSVSTDDSDYDEQSTLEAELLEKLMDMPVDEFNAALQTIKLLKTDTSTEPEFLEYAAFMGAKPKSAPDSGKSSIRSKEEYKEQLTHDQKRTRTGRQLLTPIKTEERRDSEDMRGGVQPVKVRRRSSALIDQIKTVGSPDLPKKEKKRKARKEGKAKEPEDPMQRELRERELFANQEKELKVMTEKERLLTQQQEVMARYNELIDQQSNLLALQQMYPGRRNTISAAVDRGTLIEQGKAFLLHKQKEQITQQKELLLTQQMYLDDQYKELMKQQKEPVSARKRSSQIAQEREFQLSRKKDTVTERLQRLISEQKSLDTQYADLMTQQKGENVRLKQILIKQEQELVLHQKYIFKQHSDIDMKQKELLMLQKQSILLKQQSYHDMHPVDTQVTPEEQGAAFREDMHVPGSSTEAQLSGRPTKQQYDGPIAQWKESLITQQEKSMITQQEEGPFREQEESLITQREESLMTQLEESLIRQKEERLMTQQEESLIRQKEESLMTQQEESLIRQKEESLMTQQEERMIRQNEESLIRQKGESLIRQKGESLMTLQEETLMTQREESLIRHREESLMTQQEESLIRQKEESLMTQQEESLIRQKEESLMTQQEESLIRQEEERLMAHQEESLMTQREESLIRQKEESLMTQQEESLITQKEESLVTQKKERAFQELKESQQPSQGIDYLGPSQNAQRIKTKLKVLSDGSHLAEKHDHSVDQIDVTLPQRDVSSTQQKVLGIQESRSDVGQDKMPLLTLQKSDSKTKQIDILVKRSEAEMLPKDIVIHEKYLKSRGKELETGPEDEQIDLTTTKKQRQERLISYPEQDVLLAEAEKNEVRFSQEREKILAEMELLLEKQKKLDMQYRAFVNQASDEDSPISKQNKDTKAKERERKDTAKPSASGDAKKGAIVGQQLRPEQKIRPGENLIKRFTLDPRVQTARQQQKEQKKEFKMKHNVQFRGWVVDDEVESEFYKPVTMLQKTKGLLEMMDKPSEHVRSFYAVHDQIATTCPKMEGIAYAERLGLEELFEYMLYNLIYVKPSSPIDFLIDMTRHITSQMRTKFDATVAIKAASGVILSMGDDTEDSNQIWSDASSSLRLSTAAESVISTQSDSSYFHKRLIHDHKPR